MKSSKRATRGAKRIGTAALNALSRVATIALATAWLLTLLYLLAAPVVLKGAVVLTPRILNLEQAQRYYGVIAAAVGSFAGVVGLLLGAFYYFSRLSWEAERGARERGREALGELYARIDEIDGFVVELMCAGTEGSACLMPTRKIVHAMNSFEQLVGAVAEAARMDDEEIIAVLGLYSFLENQSRLILERVSDGTQYEVAKVLIDDDEYSERLYDARWALQQCRQELESRSPVVK